MNYQLLAEKKLARKLELIELANEYKDNLPSRDTSGIYAIYCISLNKIYIGKSIQLITRLKAHRTALRNKIHCNRSLQRAYLKYGEDNFIAFMIHECSEDELSNWEAAYISAYKSYKSDYGFNKRRECYE